MASDFEFPELEESLVNRVRRQHSRMMKDLFVFGMADATPDRPGAKTRRLNAAKRLDKIFKEYYNGQ